MKRIGYLYPQIYSIENIRLALHNASRGKRDKNYVRKILKNEDHYVEQVSEMLRTHTYVFGDNRYKTIKDGASQKERDITIPSFYPDQIIHWAVIQVLQPLFMRGMYAYTCGSVPCRGCMAAKRYIERVKQNTDAQYVLKLDIRKYFPSISHDKLKELLAKKIKDKEALQLLFDIIDHGGPGLPIGYYTSQWLSNFYLQEVDHYIKEQLHIRYYVRYVDDMVLIDADKPKLHKARRQLIDYLKNNRYGIELKDNWQLWKINSRPIDFVGYRFYATHTHLRKKIFYRFTRVVRKIVAHGLDIKRARRYNAYIGWCKHINFKNYYIQNIRSIIHTNDVYRYISLYTKCILNSARTAGFDINKISHMEVKL